jgi:hypothetical protein
MVWLTWGPQVLLKAPNDYKRLEKRYVARVTPCIQNLLYMAQLQVELVCVCAYRIAYIFTLASNKGLFVSIEFKSGQK